MDPLGAPPRGGTLMPRSGPGSRGGHPLHPPPGTMGPPGSYGGSGSHKDIKLTLLNKVTVVPIFKWLAPHLTKNTLSLTIRTVQLCICF